MPGLITGSLTSVTFFRYIYSWSGNHKPTSITLGGQTRCDLYFWTVLSGLLFLNLSNIERSCHILSLLTYLCCFVFGASAKATNSGWWFCISQHGRFESWVFLGTFTRGARVLVSVSPHISPYLTHLPFFFCWSWFFHQSANPSFGGQRGRHHFCNVQGRLLKIPWVSGKISSHNDDISVQIPKVDINV